MKKLNLITFVLAAVLLPAIYNAVSGQKKTQPATETIRTNLNGNGNEIIFSLTAGEAHNHPLMAAWVVDEKGEYIQTLYVSESIARGYFRYADKSEGKWKPGKLIRPASLPVWAHSRGVKSDNGHYMPTMDNPVPDAYTSPTPKGNFNLEAKTDVALPSKIRIMIEINQSWDWNEYWTNTRFPDDEEYKSSSQPSVVYATDVDAVNLRALYEMKAIGHGHYNGSDGNIDPDLSTITTALQIFDKITVTVNAK